MGELTKGEHPVRAKDVHIATNKNKLMFVLRSSKTHAQSSRPQIIKINSIDRKGEGHQQVNLSCPYRLLEDYIAVRPNYRSDTEQFFIFRDRTPITPRNVRKIKVIQQSQF